MEGGLRELLGLPETGAVESNERTGQYRKIFSENMANLNRDLQVLAAGASRADYQQFDAQRQRLYEAFQKASSSANGSNSNGASQGMERVIAAVILVEKKAADAASGATAGRDKWIQREPDFDEAMLHIGELEESGDAKAPLLRKLGDAIRARANEHKFRDANATFDQLRPKLDQIVAQRQQVGAGDPIPSAGGTPAADGKAAAGGGAKSPGASGGRAAAAAGSAQAAGGNKGTVGSDVKSAENGAVETAKAGDAAKAAPTPSAAPAKPLSEEEVQVLEDRRRDFKQARAAWVAAKTKAEGDLEKVKEGARQEYMADADQFPKIEQGCKDIDDILDNLDDDLRDTLDQYVSTPVKNQTKLTALASEATEILDRYLNFVANNSLMKAIDLREFADVTIHAPVMKALRDLRKALS